MRTIKRRDTFVSVLGGQKVRVEKVLVRDMFDSRQDIVKIVTVEPKKGRNVRVPGTERSVFADSIRRRYFM